MKTTTNGHEQSSSDRTTNSQKLNLSVTQAALKVVLVLRNDSMADINSIVRVDLDVNVLLAGELVKDTHCGGSCEVEIASQGWETTIAHPQPCYVSQRAKVALSSLGLDRRRPRDMGT